MGEALGIAGYVLSCIAIIIGAIALYKVHRIEHKMEDKK